MGENGQKVVLGTVGAFRFVFGVASLCVRKQRLIYHPLSLRAFGLQSYVKLFEFDNLTGQFVGNNAQMLAGRLAHRKQAANTPSSGKRLINYLNDFFRLDRLDDDMVDATGLG